MVENLCPVLAAGGFESVVGLVILIISLISWVLSWFQDKKPPLQPRNRPRPAESVKTEWEKLLQDISKKNEPDTDRPAAPKPPRPSGEKRKGKASQNPAAAQPAQSSNRKAPVTRLSKSPLQASSSLGDGVRSHVANRMETHAVDAQVERDIGGAVRRDITRIVQTDLGADTTAVNRTETVHPLMQALRSPQGVRQAIIVAEILARPKSMS